METEDRPRMSVAEIALMREIIAWRKTHGWQRSAWEGAWIEMATGRRVAADPSASEVGVSAGRYDSYRWHCVENVTQAVDLLATFGYLPARFSSAYRAGWHAAQVWYDGDPDADADEFSRLFHDPENISFPAGADV